MFLQYKEHTHSFRNITIMSKDNHYFTEETEQAIIDYQNTDEDDHIERSRLYREHIKEPFEKIAEYTVNGRNFDYYATSKQDFQSRIVSHLVSIIPNFQEGEGSAFSYFTYCAWTKGMSMNKKNYDKLKRDSSIDNEDLNFDLTEEPDNPIKDELNEFMDLYIDYWEENIRREFNKERDIRIARALLDIFKKRDIIDVLDKKRALYVMIREHSGVEEVQYITKVVKKFKDHYYKSIDHFKNTGKIEKSKDVNNHHFF